MVRCTKDNSCAQFNSSGPCGRSVVATDGVPTWRTCRPTLDQVSVDILPECRPKGRSNIGRDIGWVSADSVGRVSAEISTDISAEM